MSQRSFLLPTLVILSFVLQACSRKMDPQPPCDFVQNADQQRVSWRKNTTVKLYLHSSIPVEAYAAIDRAVAEFNAKLGPDTFRIIARGVSGDLVPAKDGYSMIYWFDAWDADRPNEQARTTIYWTGSEIFEADMRINGTFDYSFDSGPNISGIDLESLVVHELGHVLGLAHNATSGSIMSTTLDVGQERRKLSDLDTVNLQCEY